MPEFLSLLSHVQRTKFTHILLKNSHKLLLFSITEIYIGLINTVCMAQSLLWLHLSALLSLQQALMSAMKDCEHLLD